MGDKKHIDRLFQENFKDFEVTPDDAVWKNIEAQLNKKKKRRVIPIWWRYAGVAALLLLMLTVGGIYLNNSNQTDTPQIVDTESTDKSTTETNQKNEETNTGKNQNTSVIANTKNEENDNDASKKSSQESINNKALKFLEESNAVASAKNSTDTANKTQNTSSVTKNKNQSKKVFNTNSSEQIAENNNTITQQDEIKANSPLLETAKNNNENNRIIKNSKTTIAYNSNSKENNTALKPSNNPTKIVENKVEKEIQTIEEAVAKNEDLLEEKSSEITLNKWSVAPNAAPVYFSSLGQGSSMGEQFNNNNKNGEVNMSYGINASYAINNRLTIRSGINRVNLGYNTNDVVAFNSPNTSASASTLAVLSGSVNDNMADSALGVNEDVTIMSTTTFKSSNIDVLKATNTSINQSFGFIEVPLELQYALSTKRFGVNVIGGFSSLFLNNYEAVSFIEGQPTSVQNEENINNTSYSANFGLGLNYKISDKINLNLEPMFKYQINTFKNTSGDFQPFFIGVYTGFGIKF